MTATTATIQSVSPWWRVGVLIAVIVGFSVLIGMTVSAYQYAPPIPDEVIGADGATLFTGDDILAGQATFLKYGLMENGTIWGHGAYLGPDFSAEYLHTLGLEASVVLASQLYNKSPEELMAGEKAAVEAQVAALLKQNRYDAASGTLQFTEIEAVSFQNQIDKWTIYFAEPHNSAGLESAVISDPQELRQLTAFFAWTSWASVANRPDKPYSYTNNFPYDPLVGNVATTDSLIWSALSVGGLLGGLAIVLFVFGRWNTLGWRAENGQRPKVAEMGVVTPSQRNVIKYFLVVALLVLAQTAVGAVVAHYRADPVSFYGLDLSGILPSNLARTWHLQLAVFWVATAFVGGALFLAPAISGKEPRWQSAGVNILLGALILVVGGSLIGEWLGINNQLGDLWFWIGNQGWEFIELGRLWQVLLAVGLVLWLVLLIRAVSSARANRERSEIASLFMIAAVGIPIFYLPALFINSMSNYTVVETWRFWIIHLWVEGFFELFATVMVAIIFFLLGVVSRKTATRVIYLDAILFLGSGIIGTGHHWYWTGQTNITMALGAVFSALEVVPLTLLTLEAWNFIKLTQGREKPMPHKWALYFLIAVGFWNFVGAGILGFLINMPIVSYYEVGTMLTPSHGHAALMGVFGMLGLALLTFALRHVLNDKQWPGVEKYIRFGFWGLNIGLALMVIIALFPGGILQLVDVLNNGYWHARSQEFLGGGLIKTIEWIRIVPDVIFAVAGVVPIVIAAWLTYITMRRKQVAA
ncbi:MAG: nitric-oxide reductase large subunit [Chloroflexi bacterium]|nr:nitric-oxide reductase large subunit [Chloroflexota bacterium]